MTPTPRAHRHAARRRMEHTGERYTAARRNSQRGLVSLQNWPCPNGCTDPANHNPVRVFTACTVFPEKHPVSEGARCAEGCESTELAMHRANPALRFDLADGAAMTCYHCGQPVCVACKTAPVDHALTFCEPCGHQADTGDEPAEVPPMLHEVWDRALDEGRCPVCAAGLPHVGTNCPEDPSRQIDTPHSTHDEHVNWDTFRVRGAPGKKLGKVVCE